MTQIANSEIDDLCERFDSEWSRESCDSAAIVRFLSQNGCTQLTNSQLLSELIKVSIERSWMAWNKHLPSIAEHLASSEVLAEFLKIPRLDSFRSLFASAADFESSLHDLVMCELLCRDLWGDAIGVSHYIDLGVNLTFRPSGKHRKVRIVFDSQTKQATNVFSLRGCTYMGRQRSTDAQDCFCTELKDGNRIVIAGWTEAEVSRNQLAIQLLNPGYAVVTNLSQVNPMQVYDKVLQPKENMISSFPFAIQLPGRKLYCN
ncbi:MAG: hypothetical protein SFV81_28705 [Pirellulaceae bacterium]|nr:hypothetical protein [Pirellulaceae bacterium]